MADGLAWFKMGARNSAVAGGYPSFKRSLQGTDSSSSVATPSPDAPIAHSDISPDDLLADLKVVIGTSKMAEQDSTLVPRIVNFSDKCERDVRSRLSMGDAGNERANRLMHVALLNGVAIGWMSSSTSSWGGGGHWGALSVDPIAQGKGVASALVKAAEQRLLDAGCTHIQIEYRFMVGNPAKERLYAWYEGKLGFNGGPRGSGFRCCHKELSAESFRAQHTRSNVVAQSQLRAEPEASVGRHEHEVKRVRSSSASSSSSSSPSCSST